MMPVAFTQSSTRPADAPHVRVQGHTSLLQSLAQLDGDLRRVVADALSPATIARYPYGGLPKSAARNSFTEIDFAGARNAMRSLAGDQGLDFDDLIKRASEHFQHGDPGANGVQLSDADLNNLLDDDDGAING